jgi:hypothetical protein
MLVCVLSNKMHIDAGTGRVLVCPFVAGRPPIDDLVGIVMCDDLDGVLLPELTHWLPMSALSGTGQRAPRENVAQAVRLVYSLVR